MPSIAEHVTYLRSYGTKDLNERIYAKSVAMGALYGLWELWYAILANDAKKCNCEYSIFNGKQFGDGSVIPQLRIPASKETRLAVLMKIAASFCLKYQVMPNGHIQYSTIVMSKMDEFRGLDELHQEAPQMGGYNATQIGTVGFPACCGTNISYNRSGWRNLVGMTGFHTLFLIWQACTTKGHGWPTMLGVLPKRYYQGQNGRDGKPCTDSFKESWWGRTGWNLDSTFINENHKSVLHYVSYDADKQYKFILDQPYWRYSRQAMEAAFRELFEKTLR
jgi:hypothetical protein